MSDFDGNGAVDGDDLATWSAAYGSIGAAPGDGDADGDGAVTGNDFLRWQREVGRASALNGLFDSAEALASISVGPVNDAPIARISGPSAGSRGQALDFVLGASDVEDSADGFEYHIDRDGEGAFANNKGQAQRFKVNRPAVPLGNVVAVGSDALALRKTGLRKAIELTSPTRALDRHSATTRAFTAGGYVDALLANGDYRLTFRGDAIDDADDCLLDVDGHSVAGSNRIDEVIRIQGDVAATDEALRKVQIS